MCSYVKLLTLCRHIALVRKAERMAEREYYGPEERSYGGRPDEIQLQVESLIQTLPGIVLDTMLEAARVVTLSKSPDTAMIPSTDQLPRMRTWSQNGYLSYACQNPAGTTVTVVFWPFSNENSGALFVTPMAPYNQTIIAPPNSTATQLYGAVQFTATQQQPFTFLSSIQALMQPAPEDVCEVSRVGISLGSLSVSGQSIGSVALTGNMVAATVSQLSMQVLTNPSALRAAAVSPQSMKTAVKAQPGVTWCSHASIAPQLRPSQASRQYQRTRALEQDLLQGRTVTFYPARYEWGSSADAPAIWQPSSALPPTATTNGIYFFGTQCSAAPTNQGITTGLGLWQTTSANGMTFTNLPIQFFDPSVVPSIKMTIQVPVNIQRPMDGFPNGGYGAWTGSLQTAPSAMPSGATPNPIIFNSRIGTALTPVCGSVLINWVFGMTNPDGTVTLSNQARYVTVQCPTGNASQSLTSMAGFHLANTPWLTPTLMQGTQASGTGGQPYPLTNNLLSTSPIFETTIWGATVNVDYIVDFDQDIYQYGTPLGFFFAPMTFANSVMLAGGANTSVWLNTPFTPLAFGPGPTAQPPGTPSGSCWPYGPQWFLQNAGLIPLADHKLTQPASTSLCSPNGHKACPSRLHRQCHRRTLVPTRR